ncbi:hypothetical protein [Nostoc sp. FACHB-133]|uniref:hypothetical protein n=1 Tax=Nostoc sp. FACHB-133 TaxID=2692835 RepID=UPI001688EFE1|nr:hypothetical protein [Nostoc sp. FACHB-133]MBD2521200.1 hypothetical protein [Nostoc sp. FACHB-133]
MGNGKWGMGNGEWAGEFLAAPRPSASFQFPMPNSECPYQGSTPSSSKSPPLKPFPVAIATGNGTVSLVLINLSCCETRVRSIDFNQGIFKFSSQQNCDRIHCRL